jgi:acyl-CoA dehydrogenase
VESIYRCIWSSANQGPQLSTILFPLGTPYRPPSDALGAQVARALLEDRAGRLRLTRDIYLPRPTNPVSAASRRLSTSRRRY